MKKIIVLLAMTFILNGCVEVYKFNYSGSSENWEVFYVADVIDGTKEATTGTFKYVGDEPAPETINYKIETLSGGAEGNNVIVEDGFASLGNSFCSGCAVVKEDEKIAVEINWNGQTENLNLTNER